MNSLMYGQENSREDMLYRMLVDNTAKYLTRHKRDWIHVHDVAEAICRLLKTLSDLLILGGTRTSIHDLADALEKFFTN